MSLWLSLISSGSLTNHRSIGRIVVEDLNVRGMLGNRHLARSLSDAGFGEFRRQLAYKS